MLPVNVIMPEDKETAGTHNKMAKKRNIHKKRISDTGRILWDSIKFCGTYDEKSMLIKGKTFYTDRRILPVNRDKRANGGTYFKRIDLLS